ncbi:MAG TPA: hypothetical protein VG099_11695, partial [Gemmataceae bacterium]|nr:hypothetical protein [Gemmataceae bacterium]
KRLLASFNDAENGMCCWDVATSTLLWQNKQVRQIGSWHAFSPDAVKLLSDFPHPFFRVLFLKGGRLRPEL